MRSCSLFIAAAVLLFVSAAEASHFCSHCGCQRECKKVCRLECGKKKQTKIEYGCECEDFCIPGRSKICDVTTECDHHGHRHHKVIWQPTCARVRTIRKLVKKEVTKEVPDYKWVVEEYCCVCGRPMKADPKATKSGSAGKKPERLPLATDAEGQVVAPSDEFQNVAYLRFVADEANQR